MSHRIRLRQLLSPALGAVALAATLYGQIPETFSNPEIDAQVMTIMASLSLEEKLAQIEGLRPSEIMENGAFSRTKALKTMPHGIGHFCQFSSALTMSPNELRDFVRAVQNFLIDETEPGIPAIFHEEAITGFATKGATTFPQQIGMGCSWNPDIVQRNSESTARSMRAAGATFALSPMLDISRTAHWERIEESYGEDSYLTSRLGVAFVQGLQSGGLRGGVAATTKHFAGYGSQNSDTKELYEDYVMPHEAAMKLAHSKSVMPSYGKYKGTAVAASKEMLTDILREQVGFDGVVVSDYGAIHLLHYGHKQAASKMIAGAMGLNAGIDIELSEPICFPLLPEALEKNLVTKEQIDDAVKRSLVMKARLGLLDEHPQIGKDGHLDFDPPAYRKLSYDAALQSIVLLKNDGILPLKSDVKRIAVVGPNADTVHCLLGDYTYQSMISFWWSTEFDPLDPKLVGLMEGLKNRLGDKVRLTHERGCDWSAPLESIVKSDGLGDDRLGKIKLMTINGLPQPNLDRAIQLANESDVVIAAVGENIYLCGEGRAREGIRLPGDQEAFVQKLLDTGKPVILVMFGGRPQIVSSLEERCAAIVQAWFPGEEGGNAIADILAGTVNPSAKLCLSYPKTEDKREVNYKNGYQSGPSIQYPFGYGLSYTRYRYSDLKLPTEAPLSDDAVRLTFRVANAGARDGTEIAQFYVSPRDPSSTMKPVQLKGFQRVELDAGATRSVAIDFHPQQLAQYKDGRWIVEPGQYEFLIGASSTDIRLRQTIDLTGETLVLENGRTLFFSENIPQ